MKIDVVMPHRCLLGEGPVWDAKLKALCWVDILNGEIHEYLPGQNTHRTLPVGQMIGAVVLCSDGNFLAAMKNGFGFVNRERGTVEMLGNPEANLPGNRFNDGKVDPAGRFWAGTMSHTDEPNCGSLYVLDKDHAIYKKISDVSISNGMAWSPDEKTYYYIDTPTFTVAAFDYDKGSGEISGKKTAIEVPAKDKSPDGMTIDNEGMLWIAHWDGWQITRWNPHTGEKLLTIPFPAARITSCAFGGDDLGDLYVTSARVGINDEDLEKQPLAGSLFVIRDIGFKGMPAWEFGL